MTQKKASQSQKRSAVRGCFFGGLLLLSKKKKRACSDDATCPGCAQPHLSMGRAQGVLHVVRFRDGKEWGGQPCAMVSCRLT